jgi:hypothetical protein
VFEPESRENQFREFRRQLIIAHPTFACPITGDILDCDDTELVEFEINGKKKTDIVSKKAIKKLSKVLTDKNIQFRIHTSDTYLE